MSWAQFAGCDLSGSDFFGTKFGHANFHDCRLLGANFTATNLSYADFEGADLTDAVFAEAIVRGTRFVRVAGLSSRDLERLEKRGAIIRDEREQAESKNLPTASPAA
ncbi:MAG: pentapeptide repeat-containing protein [Thermoanaerobaculia bacterium]